MSEISTPDLISASSSGSSGMYRCTPAKRMRSDEARAFGVAQISCSEKVFIDLDNAKEAIAGRTANFNDYVRKESERRKQTRSELQFKEHIWKILSDAILPHIPDAYLALGGSTKNGFGSRHSDLDLCLAIRCGEYNDYDEYDAVPILQIVYRILKRLPLVRAIEFRSTARVPILILQMNFPYEGIEIDINCNCVAGIYNTHLLAHFGAIDERVGILVSYFKNWAKEHGIIDPTRGGINRCTGGDSKIHYTTMLMVIHFLQVAVDPPILPNLFHLHPEMFNGKGNVEELNYTQELTFPVIRANNRSVGQLLYGLFNYYAQFDYKMFGISIRDAKLFMRDQFPAEDRRFLFFIEEAYDGMTVPKNLKFRGRLAHMINELQAHRDHILIQMLGYPPRRLIKQEL